MRTLGIALVGLVVARAASAAPQELRLDAMREAATWEATGQRINYNLGATRLTASTEAPPEGSGSLQLTYDFSHAWRWWLGLRWLGGPVPGECQRLSFQVKGDGSGHTLLVRLVDSEGASYEKRLFPVDWIGWRRVEVPVSGDKGWSQLTRFAEPRHAMQFPVKLDSLCLLPRRDGPKAGSILWSDLRAKSDVAPVDLVTVTVTATRPAGIFYRPEPIRLRAQLDNPTPDKIEGRLVLDFGDFFGGARNAYDQPVTLGPGARVEQEIAFKEDRLGVYRGWLSLRTNDRTHRLPVRFAVSEERRATPPDPESPFGMNALTSCFPPGPQREWALKLGAEAGIKWDRVGFGWGELEPAAGKFAWAPPARVSGPQGQAVDFQPGAQAFRAPNSAALNAPARSGELTIELLLRLPRLDFEGEWHMFLQKLPGAPETREYALYYQNSTHRFYLSSGDQKSSWSDMPCEKSDWEPGKWYHLLVTHKKDGETRWYVDGQPAGKGEAHCPTLVATEAPLSIGPVGTNFAFALDGLRVYDRVLTPEDAAQRAHGQAIPAQPVAAYDREEEGLTLRDTVGHNDARCQGPAVDGVLEDAARHGVSTLGLLGFPPRWASTAPPEAERYSCYEPDPQAFEQYCREVTAHYRDRVKHWEIWNEPNIDVFWEPKPDASAYARTLAAAYRGCKAGDPGCQVAGVSLAGGSRPMEFVDRVFAAGGGASMDLLSLHPYRQPQTPEDTDLVGDMRYALEIGRRHGGGKRVWITEIGWGTEFGGSGASEDWCALMAPRGTIEALASGVVDKIFWFRFHDAGWDPSYVENNYGLVRDDFSPKTAYFAYRSMAVTLAGQEVVRSFDCGSNVRAHLFEGPSRRTVALWSREGKVPLAVAAPGSNVTVVDIMGNGRELETVEGQAVVQATPAVQYLRGVPANVTVRVAARFEPAMLTLGRRETGQAELVVANPAAARARLALAYEPAEGVSVALPREAAAEAGQEARVPVRVTAAAGASPGRRLLAMTVTGPAGPFAVELPVIVASARGDAPPVAVYHFDETSGDVARDGSGGGHEARLLEGARFTAGGRRGGCLALPASGSRAEAPSAPALDLTEELTLMCWAQAPGGNGQWQWVISKCDGEETRNYGLYIAKDGGEMHFTTTFADMGRGHADPGSGSVVWDGQWHHLAVTFSRWTERLRLYVDGKLTVGSGRSAEHRVAQGGLLPAAAPLMMGQAMGGPTADGKPRPPALLDEVYVYPRALTAEEIAAAAQGSR